MRKFLYFVILLSPLCTFASDDPPGLRPGRAEKVAKHYVLTAEHTLRADEQDALAASGVEILEALPNHRYIVRTTSADDVALDPRVASVETIVASKKLDRSALREAARAHAYAHVRLVFHSDVSFDDARAAIESVGGSVDDDLLSDEYVLPQRLVARIPFGSMSRLASDDRVFAVYGQPLRIVSNNAVAAQLSHVTPLFTAPYDLSGNGVVLSSFELGMAYAAHVEFGGRLTNHVSGGTAGDQNHATHTAGTMIAAGVNPSAKGMAPSATLHVFDVRPDYPIVLNNKQNQLPLIGSVADNNSWGFQLGWQVDPAASFTWAWYGGEDYFGAYDAFYSAPYDKVARTTPVLFIHSSGNDADNGFPSLAPPFSPHGHADENGVLITTETFCYSQDGSGTDCTSPCSPGPDHCEVQKHPNRDEFTTIGPTSSLKNVLAVGAVSPGKIIATFSSRGPTHDGRVKPDLVAKGVQQFSTVTGGGYANNQGTSMSAPVVTGMTALLVEQWRKTFAGANPLPITLRSLLLEGADDLGTPGPDYTYGFGLANAQAAVDLIRADNNTGSRIVVGNIAQGQQIETPMTVSATQNVRVVVSWQDPEVLLAPDDFAEKALVNDLDLRIVTPSGSTVLPYVLDKDHPEAAATRSINSTDTAEEVEIANAAPGVYRVILSGTNVAVGPKQQYALVANSALGASAVACTDPFEPNETEATAFGFLVNHTTIGAMICTATDIDYYKLRTTMAGPLTISVTATDTPIRVTLYGNGITPIVRDIAAGASDTLATGAGNGAAVYFVRVEPNGTLGETRVYRLVPSFVSAAVRRRSTTH